MLKTWLTADRRIRWEGMIGGMSETREIICINHMEYPLEKQHLADTIQIVRDLAEALRRSLQTRLADRYDPQLWGGSDHTMEIVELYVRKSREEELDHLESAEKVPYFARVDFRGDGHVQVETYYIGRTGVNEFRKDFNAGNPYVIDWRTPVASAMFYQVKNGRAYVEAPGESYAGDILLKRQYDIESGELYDFSDDNTMEKFLGDKFLINKLLKGANQRLTDIVATIQQEQDEIIRRPLQEVTLVQGVAGSGKTTVGLHRIAYLIYTYKLNPAKMAVIAPNRLFLNYISDVLPGLQADGVWQGTFDELAGQFLGAAVEAKQEKLLERLIAEHGWQENDGFIQWLKLRGSLAYKELLDSFIEVWREERAAQCQEIVEQLTVSKKTIKLSIPGQAVAQRWLEKQSPINKVIQGINTYLRQQFTDQLRQELHLYDVKTREGGRRKERIELPIPAQYQQMINEYLRRYATEAVDTMKFYRAFLQSPAITALRDGFGLAACTAGEGLDQEDLAALCYLHLKIEGVSEQFRFEHIMVDEVQDRSAFELAILSLLSKNQSLTLLGDVNQAVHMYRSFYDWEAAQRCFTRGASSFYTMRMSYRSAEEVVECCNQLIPEVSARGIPVYKIDEQPVFTKVSNQAETVAAMVKVIREWRQKGTRSIGVIVKNVAECSSLYNSLKKSLPNEPLQMISSDQNEFRTGVLVVPVVLAKGLEFDGVIVADASQEQFQLTAMDRKLLYVALSRALYRVQVFYIGTISPLLTEYNVQA